MTSGTHFAHRFRWLKLLRASLVAGALYDLAVAALLVGAPGLLAQQTGLPLPGERFWVLLVAVLVTMLAALYLLAAKDPRRYSGVILVAIPGRMVAAACFAASAAGRPDLGGLYPLAAADAFFGLAHALFWWPIRS